MFTLRDGDAGLSLHMERDAKPRDPRFVEEPLFALLTWTPGLGDPHDWPNRRVFEDAVRFDTHLVFPLVRVETERGPVLLRQAEIKDCPIVGYAVAPHEAIRLHFGLDRIGSAIRDEVIDEAEAVRLGELQAVEDYVRGDVFRFSILDGDGNVIETQQDLYGEDLARHVAKTAFEAHIFGAAMNG